MIVNIHHLKRCTAGKAFPLCVIALFVAVMIFCSTTSRAEAKFTIEQWDPQFLEVHSRGPSYLSEDFDTGVSAPASNDSIETQADINSILYFKKDRGDAETLSLIKKENESYFLIDACKEQNLYNPDNHPKAEAFLSAIENEMAYFVLRDKLNYARARPSQLHEDINPVIPNPKHASYPSGHAAQSYILATALGDLNPKIKDTVIQMAKDIGHRREIAGIHYPTDTAAGQRLAKNVYAAMMEKEEIQKLFQDAKQEFENDNN